MFQNNETPVSAYVHPSMLEDPWKVCYGRNNPQHRPKTNAQPNEFPLESVDEDTAILDDANDTIVADADDTVNDNESKIDPPSSSEDFIRL